MKLSTKNIRTKNLTLEVLYEHLSDYDLWSYYLGYQIKLHKKIISPVRPEKDPSATLFPCGGKILLKDFYPPGEVFTIWKYLKFKYNLDFFDALKQVDSDFNLGYYSDNNTKLMPCKAIIHNIKIEEGENVKIQIKRGIWNKNELDFWLQYFNKETLDKLPIKPISHYWIQKGEDIFQFERKKNELLFAFKLEKYFKIYRPFGQSSKDKWFSNVPSNVLMGEELLSWIGDTLIITKGMKELGILIELGYNAVGLQGESSYPNELKLNTLKHRFKNIYSLMDLDKAGLTASRHFEHLGINPIYLSQEFIQNNPLHKDLAEIRKYIGFENTKSLLENYIQHEQNTNITI
tara:strand:- start:26672 stop:27712 length:1041 start_codon:yes stop_codon:yes gene_type:complete